MHTHFETTCIHGKEKDPFPLGATSFPIFQSTSFEYETAEDLERVFAQKKFGYLYSRISNPTVSKLEERLNVLEGGIGALATSSGMSAIAIALLTILKQGDEFISGNSLFGGSYDLFEDVFQRWGIRPHFVDTSDHAEIERALTPKTKLIFVEAIGNPKMDIPDMSVLSKIAKAHQIPLIVDNTVATPYLFQAKEWGADVIIHSTSKYLNGNGNAVGGAVIDSGTFSFDQPLFDDFIPYQKKFGKHAFLAKARKELFVNLGVCQAPQNAFLQLLGLETFSLRMKQHCSNALSLAKALASSKKVQAVHYPGLETHPDHVVAKKQFSNRFGGLFCFELKNKQQAFSVINALSFPKKLANIGDAKTLVIHPSSTIYVDMTDEEKAQMGVTEGLIRVSVGLENEQEINATFLDALKMI